MNVKFVVKKKKIIIFISNWASEDNEYVQLWCYTFLKPKLALASRKVCFVLMQYFKCSLHKQRRTVLITCQRIWMQLSTVITGPLSTSGEKKNLKKSSQQSALTSTLQEFHLTEVSLLMPENHPWTHCCVTQTNPQHGLFPNTARIRLITDYKSTTAKLLQRWELQPPSSGTSFLNRSAQLWATCPLSPHQKQQYLGPESPVSSVRSTRAVNYWHSNYSPLGI